MVRSDVSLPCMCARRWRQQQKRNILHVVTGLKYVPACLVYHSQRVTTWVKLLGSRGSDVNWTRSKMKSAWIYCMGHREFQDRVSWGVSEKWRQIENWSGREEKNCVFVPKKWVVYDYNHHHQHLRHPRCHRKGKTMMKLTVSISLSLDNVLAKEKGGTTECVCHVRVESLFKYEKRNRSVYFFLSTPYNFFLCALLFSFFFCCHPHSVWCGVGKAAFEAREREKSGVKGECTHPYKRKIENAEECDGGVTTRWEAKGGYTSQGRKDYAWKDI